MEDFEIKRGVNFDYILAIRFNGDSVEKIEIPIERDWYVLNRIKTIYYDDSLTAADMHCELEMHCFDIGPLQYCLQHNYSDHDIDDIAFPNFDRWQYREDLSKLRDTEISKKARFITNLKNSDPDLYRHKYSLIEEQVEILVQKKVRKDKRRYVENYLPYLYAFDYHNALEKYKVQENYAIYSNEAHGYFTFSNSINEELSIKTHTNFCYGRSCFFHLIVTYKGIDLVPYSAWVKYYFAHYNSLLKFTREYGSCRENWNHCIGFIADFANKAIKDPDRFVKEDVLYEVKGLMAGLEEIFKSNESVFAERLEVSHINEDDNRYIGISSARHANDNDRVFYSISPSECSMIYRMEKITGALHFLDSLRKFSVLFNEIDSAINRIKEMNEVLFPEIKAQIPPLQNEIESLKEELLPIKESADIKKKAFDRLDKKLQDKLNKIKDWDKQELFRENFIKNHPLYSTLENELNGLNLKISEYKTKLDDRQSLLKRLRSYIEIIKKEVLC